jgi:dTDP-glucose pyrophosphorylase
MLERIQNWDGNQINETDSVRTAALTLNRVEHKIVLVVSSEQMLVGTMTDGDLRRALLEGANLEDEISKWANRDFVSATDSASKLELISQMKSRDIHEIPILDLAGRIQGLVTDRQSGSSFNGTFVIMAGGRGTRLLPFTESTPKPMLTVGGRPIIENILISAIGQGISEFVISINYLGDSIEGYFGDGSKWGASISYLKEEFPLGTAGALSLLDEATRGPIIVVNGDIVTDLDYRSLLSQHQKAEAQISMAVRRHEYTNPYGVVQTSGQLVVSVEEKPITVSIVNTGVYVVETSAISTYLPKSQFFNMTDLVKKALEGHSKVAAFLVYEAWMDIGTPNDLREANKA